MIQRGLSSFLSTVQTVLLDTLLVTFEIRFLLMFLIESHKRIDFQLIKVPGTFQVLLGLGSLSFDTVISIYQNQGCFPVLSHLDSLRIKGVPGSSRRGSKTLQARVLCLSSLHPILRKNGSLRDSIKPQMPHFAIDRQAGYMQKRKHSPKPQVCLLRTNFKWKFVTVLNRIYKGVPHLVVKASLYHNQEKVLKTAMIIVQKSKFLNINRLSLCATGVHSQ